MKLNKLNASGFAHHLALLLVVVTVGIGGCYMLYKSHADPLGCHNQTFQQQDQCNLIGPTPKVGATSGSYAYTIRIIWALSPTNSRPITLQYKNVSSNDYTTIQTTATTQGEYVLTGLASGEFYQVRAGYYADARTQQLTYTDPQQAQSLAPYSLAECTINNVPVSISPGGSFTPTITIKNTGNTDITPIGNVHYNTEAVVNKTVSYPHLTVGSSLTQPFDQYTFSRKFSYTGFSIDASVFLPSGGFSDPSRPGWSGPATCSTPFNTAAPSISSVTINPTDYTLDRASSLVTDGSRGKVLRLKNTASVRTEPVTGNILRANPLAKLDDFVQANLSKNVEMCVTAKTPGTGNKINPILSFMKTSKTYDWNFGSNYTKKCDTFKVADVKYGTSFYSGAARSYLQFTQSGPLTNEAYIDTVAFRVVN